MFRLLFFLLSLFIPLFFGWWLFLPFSLLFVYLSKKPYEIIFSGALLDSFYYFGNSFLSSNRLSFFSMSLILFTFLLDEEIRWEKKI